MAQWTTDKFKKIVYSLVGDKYSVLSSYKTLRVPIKMRHNISPCKTFYIRPKNFLRRHNYHNGKGRAKARHFKLRVKAITNGKYSVVGNYKSYTSRILMKYNGHHSHKFYTTPKQFLYKHQLNYCNKQITTSDFKKIVYSLVGNEYSVVSPYINCMKPLKFRHNTMHPHTFYMKPNAFINGDRCPKELGARITKTEIKSTATFKREVYNLVGNSYTVIGTYRGTDKYIKLRHNTKHPHTFYVTPHKFLEGVRCTVCCDNSPKNTSIFKKEVYKLVGNRYSVLGRYKNTHTKILFRHNTKYPHTFYMTPDKFLEGGRCPRCHVYKRESYGEKYVSDWLNKHNFIKNRDYIYSYKLHSYKFCHRRLSSDFYLPKWNTIIEFDGRQHFKPIDYFGGMPVFINQVHRDHDKDNYCAYKNVILIRLRDYHSTTYKQLRKFVNKTMSQFIPLAKQIVSIRNYNN